MTPMAKPSATAMQPGQPDDSPMLYAPEGCETLGGGVAAGDGTEGDGTGGNGTQCGLAPGLLATGRSAEFRGFLWLVPWHVAKSMASHG